MCLEAFKYALNKEVYYEIIQQWYIHRYTVGGESVRDQLNLFLYLLVNLCGCFDIQRLEKELPFLKTISKSSNKQAEANEEMPDILVEEIDQQQDQAEGDEIGSVKMKRTREVKEGGDNDWEFLVSDDAFKGLSEFNIGDMRANIMAKYSANAPITHSNANLNKIRVCLFFISFISFFFYYDLIIIEMNKMA